ncbi:hypothetical protein PAGK_1946 [Cutibacterium acnes HL096PA1]|nr:hypothetical protein PAGK_1946 [Cutibacterium acnes HL096PA1]EFD02557.1 hypothetical protein HMPREF1034_1461 [Cutibacterium acnes SK187]
MMRGKKVGQYCHEAPGIVPTFPPRRQDARRSNPGRSGT